MYSMQNGSSRSRDQGEYETRRHRVRVFRGSVKFRYRYKKLSKFWVWNDLKLTASGCLSH